jgi:hypothetical protein
MDKVAQGRRRNLTALCRTRSAARGGHEEIFIGSAQIISDSPMPAKNAESRELRYVRK